MMEEEDTCEAVHDVDLLTPNEWIKNILSFGVMGIALIYLLYVQVVERQWLGRVRNFFGRKPDPLALESDGSDEDDSIILEDDEFLFRNLNPNQSVEQYRRQRFEAAAAALDHSGVQEVYNLPMEAEPLRRRENLD
ncbi:uncharacterized protein [Drosophila bipectinata]|uniref:uncharacterized protein n=1 Tax=Drosophila bipectinata TaxID=42026 RepID=UPI0038B29F31